MKKKKSYKGLKKIFDGQFTLCKYTLGTLPKVYLLLSKCTLGTLQHGHQTKVHLLYVNIP